MGMAIYATQAKRVTDEMFLVAAIGVAEQVTRGKPGHGPDLSAHSDILNVSLKTAAKIAECIFDHDLAGIPRPDNIAAHINALAYKPIYAD